MRKPGDMTHPCVPFLAQHLALPSRTHHPGATCWRLEAVSCSASWIRWAKEQPEKPSRCCCAACGSGAAAAS